MDQFLYKLFESFASTALLLLRFTAEKVLSQDVYADIFGSTPVFNAPAVTMSQCVPPKHPPPPNQCTTVGLQLRDLVREVLRSFERMFDKLVSCFGLFTFMHSVLDRVYGGCVRLARHTGDMNALAACRITELMARDRELLKYYKTDIAYLKEELQLLRNKE